jgi:hypothetical protein
MRTALKTLRRYASLKTPFRKTQWEKPEWRKEHVGPADLHTPTLLMVVFGLASMVNDAFSGDISFVVVTKMAFILNASPPFSLVLPSRLPCISLFALVLSERRRMMISHLFPFVHNHRARLHASG